VETPHYKFYMA